MIHTQSSRYRSLQDDVGAFAFLCAALICPCVGVRLEARAWCKAMIFRVSKNKKAPREAHIYFCYMAERTGLEPATPGVTGRYSNQLNYRSAAINYQKLASPRGFEPLYSP